MSEYTQSSRHLSLETPLGKDVLLLTSFTGHEELSRLFTYQLELLSEEKSIVPNDIVGKNVTITLELLDASARHFNGFVSQFSYCGTGDRLSRYTAQVVPWFWFLGLTADCRIFQERTVPEVVEQIFGDLGFQDYNLDLKGKHEKWEYCVQYRETDLNFVSRLLEKEGIFYFFKHDKGSHQMILADHAGAYRDCVENEVQFAATLDAPQSTDLITSWEHRYAFRSGKWAQTDYNFKTPKANLMTSASSLVKIDTNDKYEVYDYPGKYPVRESGVEEVEIRMEEEEAAYEVVSGSSVCRSFTPGGRFKMRGHQSKDEENKTYVITAIEHAASVGSTYEVGGGGALDYQNSFTCIPDARTFRPPLSTPKAVVQGAQTAVVVGPEGEKVYPDEYGRVKVQFHWDREGKKNENSSCWVRVSQNWAGSGWGGMFIPHIGHEVIVDFLEGDPDRPIITGRVYNAENMPPLELPKNKYQSILRDDYGNEIKFDATPGDEHILIFSPHHGSAMQIGKSLKTQSDSDNVTLASGSASATTCGSRADLWIGNKASFAAGATESGWVGAKVDVSIGATLSMAAGVKFDASWGGSISVAHSYAYKYCKSKEITVNKAKYVRASDDEVIIDSEKSVKLVGGPADNSVVDAGPTALELRFGQGLPGTNPAATAPGLMVGTALAGATAVLGLTGATVCAGALAADSQSENAQDSSGNSQDLDWNRTMLWGLMGGSLAAMTLGGIASAFLIRKLMKPVEKSVTPHTITHGSLTLDANGALLSAGPAKEAQLKLFKGVSAELKGQAKVTIKANAMVQVKTNIFDIDAIINHPNLKVLK